MQKIAKILNFWVVFLPAMVILVFHNRWIGLSIGVLNPSQAINFIKNNVAKQVEMVSAANPFDGFQLTGGKKEDILPSANETYHPNYIVQEEFFPSTVSDIVLKKDHCYVKNLTHHSAEDVQNVMLSSLAFEIEKNSDQPQILIYHTHATESYTPITGEAVSADYAWRTTDNSKNMTAVGKVMADTLNSLGYNTIQDVTLHDYPSYNGSYDLSRETVKYYLEKYPSIKIVLDVHRDAVERDGQVINPVVSFQGQKYAQIMIISGCDNGYMGMPNYRENLKFATNLQNQLAKDTPGLVRPVLFDYRSYNQRLSTGSILVEIGTHGSTLQQAKNSRQKIAKSLAAMLDDM